MRISERPAARRRSRLTVAAAAVILALVIQACSGDDVRSSDATAGDAGTTAAPSASGPTSTSEAPAGTTDDSERSSTTPVDATPVSYDDDFGSSIAPILSARCTTCHATGGPGAQRLVLESAGDAQAAAPLIGSLVVEGEMPPWPAGPLSVAFRDSRGLEEHERAAILAWVETGAALDIEPSTPLPVSGGVVALDSVDAVLTGAAAYEGSAQRTDDYRCFVFDPQLDEAAWLVGHNFVPDQTEVVHHAIGYLLPADARARAAAREAEDGLPGWECFGSSGLGQDSIFVGWAPGQLPSKYSDGSGLRMEAGEFIVLQIHYHYDGSAPADLSALELDFADGDEDLDHIRIAQYVAPAEIPCASSQSGPLCDRDAARANAIEKYGRAGVQADSINLLCRADPADFAHMTSGVASSSCDLPIYSFGEIVAVLGHEHEIGASFRMTLNPDSPDELVLLDIPDWDFDWQFNYEPVESIVLKPGDRVRIECSWDRARQRPGVEPSYIMWADGTNDEMCFSTIAVREG